MKRTLALLTMQILILGSPLLAEHEKRQVSKGTRTDESGIVIQYQIESIERDQSEAVSEKQIGGEGPAPLPTIEIENDQDREETFSKVVREAYAKLRRYADKAEGSVDFKISNFETLTADHFDEIYYADVVTLPTEVVLQMTRSKLTNEADGIVSVEYRPEWRAIGMDWSAYPEGRRMLAMTLRDVLLEVSQSDPIWQAATAITRFDVEVEFQDRKLAYKATFFWIPGKTKGQWNVRAVDLITKGLDAVLTEDIPPEGVPFERPREIGEKALGYGCLWDTGKTFIQFPTLTGTNGHTFGGHEASTRFDFNCLCTSQCQNSCTGSVSSTRCAENLASGVWDGCHAFGSSTDQSFTSSYTTGSACAAGFSCAQKACLFCLCSVTTSVSVVGAQVTFGQSDGNWIANFKGSASCKPCEPAGPPSPVLVNFAGTFDLTGMDLPVLFDIDADGQEDTISWTAVGGDEAFLVLDRNQNGEVDDGSELFGTATPQPATEDPNGFAALAVYDLAENGGNGDHVISSDDQVYGDLRLWRDANRDGVSQEEELSTLASMGVQSIELDYVLSRKVDRYGNEFRWRSQVHLVDGGRTMRAADVIFLKKW